MRFTVFTPTYNRAYIINRLYESIENQTFKDFEWIVVDDGSTDNTPELFKNLINTTTSFPIIYIRTENGGKHRAINKGLSVASGELFYIVDSDDYLPNDALNLINITDNSIPKDLKDKFAGVCGIKSFDENNIIGSTFQGQYLDITTLERPKYKITGDKAEVFYTKILRKYTFPEFEKENFITECVVWDKIAFDGYKLRFFNDTVMICNYLPDGLTANNDKIFFSNPKGYGLYLHQCDKFKKYIGLVKWNAYLKYYWTFRDHFTFKQIANNLYYPTIALWLRLFFLRLFYRFYSN